MLAFTPIISVVNAKPLVDPTRPKHTRVYQQENIQNTKPEFELSAVFINNKNKYAVINGKNYQKGQEVNGNKLIFIGQNQVVLDTTDGKKTLVLNSHSIKKDVNNGF